MKSSHLAPLGLVIVCIAVVLFAVYAPADRGGSRGESAPDREAATETNTQPNPANSTESELPPLIKQPPSGIEPPPGMVWVPGDRFIMGTNFRPAPGKPNPDRIKHDEYPAHPVEVDGFWMDATEVTNAEYKRFVDTTGYVTVAERKPKREDFIGQVPDITQIPEENLVAGSLVALDHVDPEQLKKDHVNWEYQAWRYVPGANWKHPLGPESSIEDKMDHPVVHVAFEDVIAYCDWSGKRLPTEAEYELAARGGKDQKYFWGNELIPNGKYMCNYYQGEFPIKNDNEDGFPYTSPVKSFPPNAFGLYDIAGNVWEYCSDFYHLDAYSNAALRNPQGPKQSYDHREPWAVKRVIRGGSFMCNTNNCTGYRVGARMSGEVGSAAFHQGFRCVVDTKMINEFLANK